MDGIPNAPVKSVSVYMVYYIVVTNMLLFHQPQIGRSRKVV